jgi:hypothetical protein
MTVFRINSRFYGKRHNSVYGFVQRRRLGSPGFQTLQQIRPGIHSVKQICKQTGQEEKKAYADNHFFHQGWQMSPDAWNFL